MEYSTKTLDRFLKLLKLEGAQSAASLAKEFGMTIEGARQQLAKLAAEGMVEQVTNAKGVGRPINLYRLTEKGNKRFPDTHPELTVQLLSTVKNVLGQNALNAIINAQAVSVDHKYAEALKDAKTLEEKLDRLAVVRSGEGYMAEWKKEGDSYIFIENHCPIGSAAKSCQGLCQAELDTFQNILGAEVAVKRSEHLFTNDRRCSYKIVVI